MKTAADDRTGGVTTTQEGFKKQQKSSSGSLRAGLSAHTCPRSHKKLSIYTSYSHMYMQRGCWLFIFQIHNFPHPFQSNSTSYSHMFHPAFTHVETFSHLKHIFHDRASLFLQEKERADDPAGPNADAENGLRLRAAAFVVHSGIKVCEKNRKVALFSPSLSGQDSFHRH